MSTPSEVGYYSVAMNLAMIFPLIAVSLVATLLPKMEQFLKERSMREYIFVVLSKTKYVVLIFILLELIAPFIIKLIFGNIFSHSVKIFQILAFGMLIIVLTNPISILIYYINKARVATVINWIQLPINYIGNLILIPIFGASGAALSTVIVYMVGSVSILMYINKFLTKKENIK